MATRKLVEISPAQHKQLDDIRTHFKERGERAPSIPDLVSMAITMSMDAIVKQLMPRKRSK